VVFLPQLVNGILKLKLPMLNEDSAEVKEGDVIEIVPSDNMKKVSLWLNIFMKMRQSRVLERKTKKIETK